MKACLVKAKLGPSGVFVATIRENPGAAGLFMQYFRDSP